jgi:hypothetical protein
VRFKTPLRGIHIGPTCVDGSDYEPDAAAHAHITGSGLKRDLGMVCAKTLTDLRDLLVHELAHLAADTGHNDHWRSSVRRLGGRVPAAYKRKPRRRSK